jgi:uncharacterized membrane protein YphA (DoxX/SURF4 family)
VSSALDVGLGVLHVATGVFFTVTGGRKLFKPDVHAKVSSLLASHHVPVPLQWCVMGGEFLGGLGLLTGTLTHLAALGLVLIMAGAYAMDTWPSVVAKQAGAWTALAVGNPLRVRQPMNWGQCDWSQLCSNALCTPEAQLLIIVTALAFTGAGAFSIDHLIF